MQRKPKGCCYGPLIRPGSKALGVQAPGRNDACPALARSESEGIRARFAFEYHNQFTEGYDTPDLKEAKALLDELR